MGGRKRGVLMIDSWLKEEETKAEGRSNDTEQLAGTMLTKVK